MKLEKPEKPKKRYFFEKKKNPDILIKRKKSSDNCLSPTIPKMVSNFALKYSARTNSLNIYSNRNFATQKNNSKMKEKNNNIYPDKKLREKIKKKTDKAIEFEKIQIKKAIIIQRFFRIRKSK